METDSQVVRSRPVIESGAGFSRSADPFQGLYPDLNLVSPMHGSHFVQGCQIEDQSMTLSRAVIQRTFMYVTDLILSSSNL